MPLKARHLLLLPMAACHDITAPDQGCTITSHLLVDGRTLNVTACYRVCPAEAAEYARAHAQTVEYRKCAA